MIFLEGADAVAPITQLRMETREVIEAANKGNNILIQRNNKAEAVLMSIESFREYQALKRAQAE